MRNSLRYANCATSKTHGQLGQLLTPEWGEHGVTSCARATGVMSHMRTRRHLFGYYGVESTETIPYPSTKQNDVLMAVLQPKNTIGNAIAHGHGAHF